VEHGYLERIARSLVDDDARSASIFLLAEANTMSVNGS
jgi:hypothetical protein